MACIAIPLTSAPEAAVQRDKIGGATLEKPSYFAFRTSVALIDFMDSMDFSWRMRENFLLKSSDAMINGCTLSYSIFRGPNLSKDKYLQVKHYDFQCKAEGVSHQASI